MAVGWGALPCLLAAGLIWLGSSPDQTVPICDAPPTAAGLSQRADALREALPDGYRVRVVPPFAMVLEAADAQADGLARQVGQAADRVEAVLGEAEPDTVVDLWLFASDHEYRDGTRRFLDIYPRTLRGFHSQGRHAVVVNLSTGPATLAHELAHPFIEARYPGLPAWADEGLAGLFEHVDAAGRPVPGPPSEILAKHLARGEVPQLSALTAATETQFYEDPRHLNYLQARSVMLYAHQRGRLEALLSSLVQTKDATGYAPLCEALAGGDGERLEAGWRAYARGARSVARSGAEAGR